MHHSNRVLHHQKKRIRRLLHGCYLWSPDCCYNSIMPASQLHTPVYFEQSPQCVATADFPTRRKTSHSACIRLLTASTQLMPPFPRNGSGDGMVSQCLCGCPTGPTPSHPSHFFVLALVDGEAFYFIFKISFYYLITLMQESNAVAKQAVSCRAHVNNPYCVPFPSWFRSYVAGLASTHSTRQRSLAQMTCNVATAASQLF